MFAEKNVRVGALALMAVGVALAACGAERVWTGADVGNDPSWSNGRNWQSDTAPVAGDTAIFPNAAGDIVISAADVPLFQSLPVVKCGSVNATTRLLFRPTGDVDLTNMITSIWFVKQGSGTTSLKGGQDKTYQWGNFVVESGALGLQTEPTQNYSYYSYGHVAVSNGATLYLPYDGDTAIATMRSLNSEGTIDTARPRPAYGSRASATRRRSSAGR